MKRLSTGKDWQTLIEKIKEQQSQDVRPEADKEAEPKIEVHVHNVVPAPEFSAPKNRADLDLERLSQKQPWA